MTNRSYKSWTEKDSNPYYADQCRATITLSAQMGYQINQIYIPESFPKTSDQLRTYVVRCLHARLTTAWTATSVDNFTCTCTRIGD